MDDKALHRSRGRSYGYDDHSVEEPFSAKADAEPRATTPVPLQATQAALIDRERQLNALFEGALDAILICDEEGRYMQVNPAACDLFGGTREQILGRSVGDFAVPGFDVASAWRAFLDVGSASGEFTLRRLDGDLRVTEFRARAHIAPGQHLSVLRDITERRRAERAVVDSERRFRALVERSGDVFALTDPSGRILYISPSIEPLAGVTANELVGEDGLGFFDAADRSRVEEVLRELTTSPGASRAATLRLRHRDGSARTVEIVFTNHLHDPAVAAIVAVLRDVTEREETRANARKREARIQALVRSNVIGVFGWSAEGFLVEGNEAFRRISGRTEEEIASGHLRVDAIVPPERRGSFERARGEMITSAACMPYETECLRSDGGRVPILAGGALEDEGGGRGVGLMIDVTKERHAQEQVRQSNVRFRALLANSGDMINLVDRDGVIVYASPSTERVLGHSEQEHVGKKIFEFVHPEDEAAMRQAFAGCLAQPGVVFTSEVRHRHKDGTFRLLELTRVNCLDDPALRAVVTNYRDVTEKRHLFEQLVQAQKMEAIGLLAGGLAHDFNNILSVILSSGQLLLEGLPPDLALRAEAVALVTAGERAAALTRQLLAFGRKQVMRPAVVNLNVILLNLRTLLTRLVGDRLTVTMRLDSELSVTCLDPSHIEQVVLNLVVNARDAMRGKEGRIVIETCDVAVDDSFSRTQPELRPGHYVRLRVADTGVGIAPEIRTRIWEPFFTTKEPGQGTGLGLSTVFGIVKQSGGQILVESEPGRGSQFDVYFPLRQSDRQTPPPASPH